MYSSNSYLIRCVTSLININNINHRNTRKTLTFFPCKKTNLPYNSVMFLYRGARITFYLFLTIVHSGVAHKSPIGPSAVLEAVNITNKENNVKSEPPSSHDFKNRRFPSGFSYFSNCLSKQGVVFLGRPCGLMPATSCGGFNCASGIGFPISTVCCK